jgi:FAD/FMN-containing dehydrogenase
MAVSHLDSAVLDQLRENFRGQLVMPGDDAYDSARSVFNGGIDRRPAVIARCSGVADVIAAVDFARVNATDVSVRGGGHAVTGSAVVDGGLVIDLAPMNGIQVDPERRTARAQAGVTWGELDRETQAFGLAVTGGRVSSTGISGLTLGSGSGWLERSIGFTCDNLVSADLVLADGSFVTAAEDSHPDLLWALKGGGGNFGVVTSFEYRLHPVGPLVAGGMLAYPGPLAPQVFRAYRDFMENAPDAVGGALAFITAPPEPFVPEAARGQQAVAVIGCYHGPVEEGLEALAPLRDLAGPPVLDMLGPMPYTVVQQLIDAGNPPGRKQYWKAEFIDEMTDEAIDAAVGVVSRVTSPFSVVIFQPMGGALSRVPEEATPLGRRDAAFAYHALSQWEGDDDERHVAWTREFAEALAPHATSGVFVNYTGDQTEERVRATYGPEKYERLVDIKDRYDPANMFRLNANIRPSAEAAGQAERA